MNQRSATLIAIGLFAGLVFIGSLAYGLAVSLALLSTIAVSVIVGGIFLGLQHKIDLLNSVTGVTLFATGGVIICILFFAGDCLGGYFNAPTTPFLEACVNHSGAGFGLTVGISIILGSVVIVALIRVTMVHLFYNG